MQIAWVDLPEYPVYQLSSSGLIRSKLTKRIIRPVISRTGNVNATLFDADGRRTTRSMALLVATYFLDPPEEPHMDTPIHKDGDKSNCNYWNLAWRTRSFAIRYHQQFDRPYVNRMDNVFIRHKESGKIFSNSLDAAIHFGLLEQNVVYKGIICGEWVWPGYHHFEVVQP